MARPVSTFLLEAGTRMDDGGVKNGELGKVFGGGAQIMTARDPPQKSLGERLIHPPRTKNIKACLLGPSQI